MRLKWRVQGCWLDSYGHTWVTCYGPTDYNPDNFAEQYGLLKFQVPKEDRPKWWAGLRFETEVPFVARVAQPAPLLPVPETMSSLIDLESGEPADIYEEIGNDRRGRRRRR